MGRRRSQLDTAIERATMEQQGRTETIDAAGEAEYKPESTVEVDGVNSSLNGSMDIHVSAVLHDPAMGDRTFDCSQTLIIPCILAFCTSGNFILALNIVEHAIQKAVFTVGRKLLQWFLSLITEFVQGEYNRVRASFSFFRRKRIKSRMVSVESLLGRFDVRLPAGILPLMSSHERLYTAGFLSLAADMIIRMSDRDAVYLLNRVLMRGPGIDAISLTSLTEALTRLGVSAAEYTMLQVERILNEWAPILQASPVGLSVADVALTDETVKAAIAVLIQRRNEAIERAEAAKAREEELAKAQAEGRAPSKKRGRCRKGQEPHENKYAEYKTATSYDTSDRDCLIGVAQTLSLSIDSVLSRHQKDERDTDEKTGEKGNKFVENCTAVLRWTSDGKEYAKRLGVHPSMVELLKETLAFIVTNNLLEGRHLVIFSDGASDIREASRTVFGQFKIDYSIILDPFHLFKRVKECMSMSFCFRKDAFTKADRNDLQGTVDYLLWRGRVADAIALLKGFLSPEQLRAVEDAVEKLGNSGWLEEFRGIEPVELKGDAMPRLRDKQRISEIILYIFKHRGEIPCYELRKELGLQNSSNMVEKANDLLVALRQKHCGRSWGRKGSFALAKLTALKLNGVLDRWFLTGTLPGFEPPSDPDAKVKLSYAEFIMGIAEDRFSRHVSGTHRGSTDNTRHRKGVWVTLFPDRKKDKAA